MAPNRETPVRAYPKADNNIRHNPLRLSMETLQRTVSNIASELSKEAAYEADGEARLLPPIRMQTASVAGCPRSTCWST